MGVQVGRSLIWVKSLTAHLLLMLFHEMDHNPTPRPSPLAPQDQDTNPEEILLGGEGAVSRCGGLPVPVSLSAVPPQKRSPLQGGHACCGPLCPRTPVQLSEQNSSSTCGIGERDAQMFDLDDCVLLPNSLP